MLKTSMGDDCKRAKQEIIIIRMKNMTWYECDTLFPSWIKQKSCIFYEMEHQGNAIFKVQIVQFYLSIYFPGAQH